MGSECISSRSLLIFLLALEHRGLSKLCRSRSDCVFSAPEEAVWSGSALFAILSAAFGHILRPHTSHLMRLLHFSSAVNSILQTCMRSHPMGQDVWFLVGPFVYFHTSCVRTAKALARLRRCAGSPEPSLVAYVISTIISWAGSVTF